MGTQRLNATLGLQLPETLSADELSELEGRLLGAGAVFQDYHISAANSKDGKEHTGRRWFVNPSKVESMEPFKPYIGRKLPDRRSGAEEKGDGGKESVILRRDAGGYQSRRMTAAERSADDGAR